MLWAAIAVCILCLTRSGNLHFHTYPAFFTRSSKDLQTFRESPVFQSSACVNFFILHLLRFSGSPLCKNMNIMFNRFVCVLGYEINCKIDYVTIVLGVSTQILLKNHKLSENMSVVPLTYL